jgi:hypothetical protein
VAGSVRPVLSAFFAALGSLVAFTAAHRQGGSDLAYTQGIETLCRQYAAAVSGMPTDQMFDLCMAERHCRRVSNSYGYRCEMPEPLNWHGGY